MNEQLKQLQNEVHEWSSRNFPNNKPHHPLLGIVEEFGELGDAIQSHDFEMISDGLADAMIYLADYCARNGVQLRHVESFMLGAGVSPIAKLCHYHLKGEQGIRYAGDRILELKQAAVDAIVCMTDDIAKKEGLLLWPVIESTWDKVKQRDWQKNPINAAKVAEAQTA